MEREKITAVAYAVGPAWDPQLPMGKQANAIGHMRYMRELRDSGLAIVAGPHWTPAEMIEDAVGLAVLRLDPIDAEEVVGKDPAIAGGQLRAIIRPFFPLQPVSRVD